MLVQMQEGWKLIQSFLSVPCQRWQWLFSSWDPKTSMLKNEYMNRAEYFNVDSDAVVFG